MEDGGVNADGQVKGVWLQGAGTCGRERGRTGRWVGVTLAKSTWPVLGAGTLFGLNGESLKDFPYMSDMVRSTF